MKNIRPHLEPGKSIAGKAIPHPSASIGEVRVDTCGVEVGK